MDIVKRLRDTTGIHEDLIYDAADEIERLREDNKLAFELMDTLVKEINRLKRGLRLIASMESDPDFGTLPISEAQKIAQDALGLTYLMSLDKRYLTPLKQQ